ncbi:acyl-CoA desaturase [Pendulispora albinea]|uniref:Acyl-CoA desaturase n=1 Tax=Pendulispora albinea TaxID=2741071 RepID=A0ABZ2LWP0_9BACT
MTQTTMADAIPPQESTVLGMADVTPSAHRLQARIALAIMIVPALGTIEAARLALRHEVGAGQWILFAVMYFVHMGGVTMGLHRLLAHRAFSTSKALEVLLIVCGSMAGQGPVLYWVSTHRAHHAYSDTEGDPHTPQLHGEGWAAKMKGLWYAHMPWMLSRRVASPGHFARDLLRNRTLVRLNESYFIWLALGFVIPAVAGGLLAGSARGAWVGFIVGGLARMFLANQAAWCVGSVCHMFGSRPFRTNDSSANSWWVAILTFGEGLQNNHHAFPSSYRHAVRWWEPDLSGWCIALLAKMKLVWSLKHPSPAVIERVTIRPSRKE